MKEVIEEFKKRNGNASFTNKEMLMYLVTKVDDLVPIVAGNRSSITMIKWIFSMIGIILLIISVLT